MMFPPKLREEEYIRMVAIRKDKHGNPVATKVGFVKNFEEYSAFVEKYKYTHDIYNQIATNRGDKDGKKTTQRQRRVLFLDFDGKDYPELHDASDFSSLIHEKLPQLFLHACVASGHGFHFYVSIKGYIEFYFNIAGALIDGRISQTDYIVFITLVRNLSDGKKVT